MAQQGSLEREVWLGVSLCPHKPQLGLAFIQDRRAISRASSLFGVQEEIGACSRTHMVRGRTTAGIGSPDSEPHSLPYLSVDLGLPLSLM